MGYQTVMRVPKLHTYADALKKWNNTKPMRGRDEDKRPLGERRDVDTYSIRKNVWTDAIECVLYQTPVVTFTTEDEVKIKFGTWSSASTCQFISRILVGVGAYRVRGDVVLGFAGNIKAMVRDHEELVLVRTGNGAWMPKETQTLYDYRVSRKEANNVRKMVSQFKDYLNGVIKLKGDVVTTYGVEHEVIRSNYTELFEVFGMEYEANESGRVRPNVDKWLSLDAKPKYFRPDTKHEAWVQYRALTAEFFDLVKNDQDDNCRHQNYWIAFNILFVQGQRLWWREPDEIWGVTMGSHELEKYLDKILFKMFSDKVYTKVALAEGKVPTGKYDDYVMTEED